MEDQDLYDVVDEVVEQNEHIVQHADVGYKDLKYSSLNLLVQQVKEREEIRASPMKIREVIKERINE